MICFFFKHSNLVGSIVLTLNCRILFSAAVNIEKIILSTLDISTSKGTDEKFQDIKSLRYYQRKVKEIYLFAADIVYSRQYLTMVFHLKLK